MSNLEEIKVPFSTHNLLLTIKRGFIHLNKLRDKIIEVISNYPGPALGSLGGLIVGLLIITFGLLKVILLIICIIVGIFVGAMVTRTKE